MDINKNNYIALTFLEMIIWIKHREKNRFAGDEIFWKIDMPRCIENLQNFVNDEQYMDTVPIDTYLYEMRLPDIEKQMKFYHKKLDSFSIPRNDDDKEIFFIDRVKILCKNYLNNL